MMMDDENDPVDVATTTDTNADFETGVNSPVASTTSTSANMEIANSEMPFLNDSPPLSPGSLVTEAFNLSGRELSVDSTLPSDAPNVSSATPSAPSISADLPGPSNSFTELAREESIALLNDSLFEDDDYNLFLASPHSFPTVDIDSNNSRDNDENDGEPINSDQTDQLFAPDESSSTSSSESSPSSADPETSPFLFRPGYPSSLRNRQNSTDDHSLRTNLRCRRSLRPQLSVDFLERTSPPEPTGFAQRMYSRSRQMQRRMQRMQRMRMRRSYADLFSGHKLTPALNTVTSNGDAENSTNMVDAAHAIHRNYQSSIFLPKSPIESRFLPFGGPPSKHDVPRRMHFFTRPLSLCSPSPTFLLPLRNTFLPTPSTSVTRARSVSPTSASPNISASVHAEPLDDIGINWRSDNSRDTAPRSLAVNPGDELPRPRSPLPPVLSPTLSDDTVDFLTTLPALRTLPERWTTSNSTSVHSPTCRQPMNLTMNSTMNKTTNKTTNSTNKHCTEKEAPRTYEELNSELIQLLECPICFEFTTPPINQCLQGHIVCNNCRQRVTSCPTCRTMFQESRNLVMEKVAALLRYPCKNAVTGCMEFLYLLQKEQHEKSCGFRQYVCFLPDCKWRGYKPELLVHVQEVHEDHVVQGPSTNLQIPVSGHSKKVWLMSAFNELFYIIFFTTMGVLKGCVRFIGDCSKCDSYTYNISVTSEEDMLRNFNFTRTTHAYEESFESAEMVDSYDLFSISHAQLNLFRKGTKAPVRITIEEAQKRTGE